MKKEKLTFIVSIILTIIFIVVLLYILNNGNNYNFKYDNKKECNKVELLLTKNGRKIYTYCLENITITINNEEKELKKYIENNNDAISEISKSLKLESILSDGGTKIYKGDITLIKCNTIAGNKDVYIGNSGMKFKENFCKNNNYTFTRTYTIKNISEYKEQQYTEDGTQVSYGNSYKVTLNEFGSSPKTIIINNLWDITLEEDKTYEFEFMLYEDATDIKDDVEYIFNHSTIVEIKPTLKKGFDQIREPIIKK